MFDGVNEFAVLRISDYGLFSEDHFSLFIGESSMKSVDIYLIVCVSVDALLVSVLL